MRLLTHTEIMQTFVDLVDSRRLGAVNPEDITAYRSLGTIRNFLQDILDGSDPKDVLHIVRKKGVKAKPHSMELAIFIYIAKYEIGEKWTVVESLATEWLADRDLPALSLPGLKKHCSRHREKVDLWIKHRNQMLEQSLQSLTEFESDPFKRHEEIVKTIAIFTGTKLDT